VIQLQPDSWTQAAETGQSHYVEFLQELWRRVKMEFVVEWPMLRKRWKTILFGGIFQYVHGIFTLLELHLHQAQKQPLGDAGFYVLPELGQKNAWVSETLFGIMFGSFLVWTFTPFVVARKRFYTVVLFSRILMVLVACQSLRIVSFLSTQLPAPNYHCRLGPDGKKITPDWPDHWWGNLIVNPKMQATHGCGDLIFSSHTTFVLVGVLTYTEYGGLFFVKVLAWILGFILSMLIIASRKHYTVDVIVAWYTVPLVFHFLHRRWTTKRDMVEDGSQDEGLELQSAASEDSRDVLLEGNHGVASNANGSWSSAPMPMRSKATGYMPNRLGDQGSFSSGTGYLQKARSGTDFVPDGDRYEDMEEGISRSASMGTAPTKRAS